MAWPLIAAMAAGAVAGGAGSYFSSESAKDALNSQLEYLKSLSPQLQNQYQDQIKMIESALAKRTAAAGGEETLTKYQQMVQGYSPEQYAYTPEDFAYTSGVEAFQDPAAEYRMKAAKQSAYQMYRDKIADTRASLSQQEQGYLTQLGLLGQQKSDIYSAQDTALANQLQALQQYQQNVLNLGQTTAGVEAQKAGISTTGNVIQSILGGASTGANIYGAFKK